MAVGNIGISKTQRHHIVYTEIGEIAFLSELKKRREKIDEINEALLRYF